MYVKTPAVRATISFDNPIYYALHGQFVGAKAGIELFSGMADVLVKFVSQFAIVLQTSGFTRIRLPVIVHEKDRFIERIVLMTSHDRTIVAANSSRLVNQSNVLNEFEHNTPLLLLLDNGCAKISVDVNSGGNIHKYNIGVTSTADGKKFQIPNDLDVKSHNFLPKLFDAEFTSKKTKHQ